MSIKTGLVRRFFWLFAFGFLVRIILAWLPEKYLFYLVSDDAYYYFSVAKNLLNRGLFSADGITATNGFHPLWLFVITPLFGFYDTAPWLCIRLALSFSALLDTATAVLIYLILNRLNKPGPAFWAAAFYLFNPYALLHTMNGLETALNNFFIALLIYLSIQANPHWLESGWFYMGTVGGLAFLSRTDNVFVLATLFSGLFFQGRRFSPLLKMTALVLLVAAPWLVYNWLFSGTLVQSSGTAYPFHYRQVYLNEYGTYGSLNLLTFTAKQAFLSFAENAWHYGNWILTLLVAGLVLRRWPSWPASARPLGWAFAAAGVFLLFHLLVRWSVRPWYFQEAFVLTLPAVAVALERMNRYLVAAGAIAAFAWVSWYVVEWKYRVADRSKVMLNIIQTEIPPPDRVGVFNSGYVQYFTDQKVINLDGLANNEVLPYYRQQRGFEYLQRREIGWLLDQPSYLVDRFSPYFGTAGDSLLEFVHAITNISIPGNTVMLVRAHLKGASDSSRIQQPLGPLIQERRRRGIQHFWGKVPLFEWIR